MSICHSCIGPGRSNRTIRAPGAASAAGPAAGPAGCRIRSIVRSDGTTSSGHGRACAAAPAGSAATPTADAPGASPPPPPRPPAATCCGHDRGRCDRSANPASCSVRYRADPAVHRRPRHPYQAATSTTSARPTPPGPRPAAARPQTTQPVPIPALQPGRPTETTGQMAEHDHCRTSPGGRLSRITRRRTRDRL